MPLERGTVIGPYQIAGVIGAGGMGEVYRARDTKLGRDVAIKVLPDLFARDPERIARFEREARMLASLNHPHIAHIYGVEERALVMELVEGEDLAARLARSGPIPLDEALPLALQIAEALEEAHAQGIVHRDLKPANIKVRPDGMVKILDFGLAKALDVPASPAAGDPDNSPTITSPLALSNLGVMLGTAAYMAPEQAKGKPLDKRVDIWAFGCVLYEMLTARRAFAGEDVTDTLAAIVRADPDWSELPADTPPHLRTLLRRCLVKDRRERLPDIGAARLELKDPSAPMPTAVSVAPPRRNAAILPWALAGLASLGAVGAIVYVVKGRSAPDTRVYKTSIVPPGPLNGPPALRFQISPDGQRFVFAAPDQTGQTVLWVRALDTLTAQPLSGTVDAQAPFWSPDSRWVAFVAEGKLKKVDLSSGAMVTICDTTVAPPGTWNQDDVILFTGPSSNLARVSASGGTPVNVTVPLPGEIHVAPFFLPDGRRFIFTVTGAGARQPGIFLGSLDSKDSVRLLEFRSNASYANGRLVFLRDATLMAQPFDSRNGVLSGTAVPIAEGLQMNPSTGTGAFSLSNTGVLIYQTGNAAGTQLTWFDRAGKSLGTLGEPRGYRDVQISPDGHVVSVTITAGSAQGDIWLFDIDRKLEPRRFTFDESTVGGAWTRDGRRLAYGSRRGGGSSPARDLFSKAANGSGAEELLLQDEQVKVPVEFTPDGQLLLYWTPRNAGGGELWLLPLSGERKPRPFLAGKATITAAAISPDGKWIAYSSIEKGRRDVYVTAFPGGVGKWQVSTGGGDNPMWRADGAELFFTSNDKFMTAEVKTGGQEFEMGDVRPLFSARVPAATLGTRATYAVSRDGQRILVNTWDGGASVAPITVVVNWPASIK